MIPQYGPGRRLTMVAALLLLLLPAAGHARTIKLLVFGDSLTAGYGLADTDAFQAQLLAALRKDGRDVQILDGGVSGDTTTGARARLDWVLADKPDAAFVELGGNDGLRGIDPHEMQANLTAILDSLAAHHIPVLAERHVRAAEPGRRVRRPVPRRVHRPRQAAGAALRPVLPGRCGRRPGVQPGRPHPPERHRG